MTNRAIRAYQRSHSHLIKPSKIRPLNLEEKLNWMRRKNPDLKIRVHKVPDNLFKLHGAREMLRRKKQIIKGQLKVENGLVA